MTKIVKIDSCESCPFLDSGSLAGRYCGHPDALRDRTGADGGCSNLRLKYRWPNIPNWCPLEDAAIPTISAPPLDLNIQAEIDAKFSSINELNNKDV